MVFRDTWSLMAVVSQDSFYCNTYLLLFFCVGKKRGRRITVILDSSEEEEDEVEERPNTDKPHHSKALPEVEPMPAAVVDSSDDDLPVFEAVTKKTKGVVELKKTPLLFNMFN